MKMSSAIKFCAQVSVLYAHQSANDIARIFFLFFARLVNMVGKICEALILLFLYIGVFLLLGTHCF